MLERFKVHFDPNDIRDVFLDGQRFGRTETVLLADGDEYKVTLSGTGFSPPSQTVLISGTSVNHPLVITFDKVMTPATGPGPGPSPAP